MIGQYRNSLLFICVSLLSAVAEAGNVHALESDSDLVGRVSILTSRYEDTMVDIGRANSVGFEELRRANPGVDPWLPGEGTELLLPTAFVLPRAERQGLVVNIAEYRVYFYYREGDQQFVATVPASIGRMDWSTPLGRTKIVARAERPSWYPPESVRQEAAEDGRDLPRVVPPGPDNPLGDYALRLGLPGYLIHGTNRPAGVGMQVTHGCIRLFPEDIEWLFPRASVNTPVQIVNQPVKFGWFGDELYLEVHPPLAVGGEEATLSMTRLTEEYVRVTRERPADVDWQLITEVFSLRRGVPVRVGALKPARETAGHKKAAVETAASSG
jgi:L,D-transpeptidase ErfK/SrfK